MSFFEPPRYQVGGGIATEYGTITPPGGLVAGYVRSTGPQNQDHPDIKANLYTDLNQALAKCRSGMSDFVFVLPGHVQNVAVANQFSNLVAGTQIIGVGSGTTRPTFTWTAAAATWLFNKAGVKLSNCILNMDPGAGSVTVAAPLTASAAGITISGCQMRMGTSATALVTIGVTVGVGADDFSMMDCETYGATAATCTTQVRLTGVARPKIRRCKFTGATSAVGVGVVQMLTTASTDCYFEECWFQNSVASSTAAFTGMAASTGALVNCRASVLSGGLNAFATLGNLVAFGCTASNALGGGNAVSPAAQTMA